MVEDIKIIYKGYFSSESTIDAFLRNLPDDFQNRNIKIADFGGGSGYLLSEIEKFYRNKNFKTECWLIDKDKKQLEKAPSNFHKINKNFLRFVKKNYFDLVIMRSVLQFLVNYKHKVWCLNNIYDSLKLGGFFIDQALFFEGKDNEIIAKAFRYFNRLVKIETLSGLMDIYNRSYFRNCKIKDFCPIMLIDNNDIQQRFNIDNSKIKKIFNLFKRNINYSHSIEVNHENFQIRCNYVILESKK